MNAPALSFQAWVKKITASELPAFGQTLAQLASIDEFRMSHATELTRIVLRDPGMTAKVLRLANTAYFNPGRRRVSTVSRAVVIIGFRTLRSLCIASLLIDELLQKGSPPLKKEIARAFHAAIQARELAALMGEKNREEVFIAALLYRLGDLTFWMCGGDCALRLQEKLAAGEAAAVAEDEVLGFRLRSLSHALAHEWRFNDVLLESIKGINSSVAAKCVNFADELVAGPPNTALVVQWSDELLQRLQLFTGRTRDELVTLCNDARQAAGAALRECGVGELAGLLGGIPSPDSAAIASQFLPEAPPAEPDTALQFAVIRELTMLARNRQRVDINLVLQLVLEGLYRGAGLPRVVVALNNRARSEVTAKSVLEWPASQLQSRFHFELKKTPILQQVLADHDCYWAGRDADEYGFGVLLKTTGGADCLIGPLAVGDKNIGVFYADRFDQALSTQDLEAFMLLLTQARLCLHLVQNHSQN